jgi:hypothetical protein
MEKLLIAFALVTATLAAAAPVLAMTPSEYRTEHQRMSEQFSQRFVDCVKYSGMERAHCQSNLRHERDNALRDLKKNYEAHREEEPKSITRNP